MERLKAFVRNRANLVIAVAVAVVAGIGLSGYAAVTKVTSSQEFCTHACHEMERTVYAEYAKSKHHTNASGQTVTCAQCHLPQNNWPALMSHQVGALSRVWGHYVDREYLPGRFEARRPELAKKVLAGFAETNARECKACHSYVGMLKGTETAMAKRDHSNAMKTDGNCMECHKGLVHQRQDQPAGYDF